jgi:hypothetical protein
MPERAAIVAALIVERPLYEACILLKSGLRHTFVETMAAVRGGAARPRVTDRCRACGETKTVLSLDRPER